MSIKIGCSKCSATLSLKDQYAGKKIHCPRCKHVIEVPAAEEDPFADLNFPDEEDFGRQHSAAEDDSDDELMSLPKLPKRKSKASPPPLKARPNEKESPASSKARVGSNGQSSSLLQSKWVLIGAGGAAIFLLSIGIGYFLASGSDPTAQIDAEVSNAKDSNAKDSNVVQKDPPPDRQQKSEQQPQPSDDNPNKKKPVAKVASSTEQKALRDTLAKMQKLIAAKDDREFFIQFAPTDELRKFQQAEAEGQTPPAIPHDSLKVALAMVADKTPELDSSGLSAVFLAEGSRVDDPEWAAGPGYQGEIQDVIARAIAEIEHGDIKQLIKNMFPPDVLSVMFRNGPDHAAASLMNQKSAMVVRMLEDLQSLQSLKPKIKGDVAEFVLPAVVYESHEQNIFRPFQGDRYPIPDRLIRFSLINKRWRFYDDGSMRRAGMLDAKGVQLRFERLGTSWRLAKYP